MSLQRENNMEILKKLLDIAVIVGAVSSLIAYALTNDQHFANWAIIGLIAFYGSAGEQHPTACTWPKGRCACDEVLHPTRRN